MLRLWERYHPQSPLGKGEYILVESDVEQEVFYQQFLLPLWEVWNWPIGRESTHPLQRILFFQRVIAANKGVL